MQFTVVTSYSVSPQQTFLVRAHLTYIRCFYSKSEGLTLKKYPDKIQGKKFMHLFLSIKSQLG